VAGSEVTDFFARYDRTRSNLTVTSPLRQYLDKAGNQIHKEEKTQQMTSWDLIYHILRANFDGFTNGYCAAPEPVSSEQEPAYRMGCVVSSVEEASDTVEVVYKDHDGKEQTIKTPLLIAADGPSSTTRGFLLPEIKRKYAGYVAWRGTVPEPELSEVTRDAFVEKFSFFHAPALQILSYTIPGDKGSLKTGERLVNWVWYCNYEQESSEYHNLMTDMNGQTHHNSISGEAMQPEVWKHQKQYAKDVLAPQFAELVQSTKVPFVQAITDVVPKQASFFGDKILLVGDALAGFRPHTAASTGQAAFHASLLYEYIKGEKSLADWAQKVVEYGSSMQKHGVQLGDRSQFGKHPLA
jgi:2-polyprenyl-6-methoxyphenol hydroxylase-like FAD-dependent oxidoreductase